MSGWSENNFLKFMQVHGGVFGEDITHVKDADDEWLARRFTKGIFHALDWRQVINTPYVDVSYQGKGDIEKIKVKNEFCLTAKQCSEIAGFVACRFVKNKLNELDSFAVISYIRYGAYIGTDYIRILQDIVSKALKGGE